MKLLLLIMNCAMWATCLSLSFLSLPVLMAQAPKTATIDFTQKLLGVDGKSIPLTNAKDSPPTTLGDVAVNCLENLTDQEMRASSVTGVEKLRRADLAHEIYQNKHAVLPIEDVLMIKERIGEMYGPMIVGAAWPMLITDEKKAE